MLGMILAVSLASGWIVPDQSAFNNNGAPGAQLSFVCGGRDNRSGSIVFSSPIHLGGRNGHSTWREIDLQVDDHASTASLWRYDEFKAIAAQHNNVAQLAKILKDGHRLTVHAIDDNGADITATFDVGDTVETLKSAQQACAQRVPPLAGKAETARSSGATSTASARP